MHNIRSMFYFDSIEYVNIICGDKGKVVFMNGNTKLRKWLIENIYKPLYLLIFVIKIRKKFY